MADSERESLLNPEADAPYVGLPTRRSARNGGSGVRSYGGVGLSSGGDSWNRRISEYARSPPALGTSLDSASARKDSVAR